MLIVIIEIKVKPNSREEKIEGNTVYLTEKPDKNKANIELIKFLKKHYKAGSVRIISGLASRKKKVEVL